MSLWETLSRISLTRGDIPALVVYSILVGVLSLATPLAVQALVNTVAFGMLMQPVIALASLLFGGLAFAATLQAMQIRVLEHLQQRAMVRVGIELAGKFPKLSMDAYAQLDPSAAASRLYDVVTVQKAGAALLLDGIALLLQTAIAMVVLALYHPILLGFDVLLLLCVVVIFWGLGRGAYKTAVKESKQKHALASWLRELAQPLSLWRGAEGAEFAVRHADSLAQEYLSARRAHFRVLFRQIVGALVLQVFASALLLGLGGWLVIRGQLTLGQLVAAELILSAVLIGLAKLGKHLEKLYDLLAAADKLRGVMELPTEEERDAPISTLSGPAALSVRGVGFSFSEEAPLLRDVTLSLKPGSVVGIRGESGVGKSTFVGLLSGLLSPQRGSISLDGLAQRSFSLRQWRGSVVSLSGPELFSGTISENLSLGDLSITIDAQQKILSDLGLPELVGCLNMKIRADGSPLSRGQALRLTLARVLLRQPRLLILDGLLDELSPAARTLVMRYLQRPDAPWTLLLISNHYVVLSRCDEVYELKGGELCQMPTKRSVVEGSR
jgi:putative ABC transport system ATP-binding protein